MGRDRVPLRVWMVGVNGKRWGPIESVDGGCEWEGVGFQLGVWPVE